MPLSQLTVERKTTAKTVGHFLYFSFTLPPPPTHESARWGGGGGGRNDAKIPYRGRKVSLTDRGWRRVGAAGGNAATREKG